MNFGVGNRSNYSIGSEGVTVGAPSSTVTFQSTGAKVSISSIRAGTFMVHASGGFACDTAGSGINLAIFRTALGQAPISGNNATGTQIGGVGQNITLIEPIANNTFDMQFALDFLDAPGGGGYDYYLAGKLVGTGTLVMNIYVVHAFEL